MYRYFSIPEYICMIVIIIYIVCIIGDIKRKEYKNLNFLFSILILGLSIFVTFFKAPAFVVGASMNPTLVDKQILILDKLDRDFEKNDIVVLQSQKLKKKLIKRIVAVGGDTVSMKDGQLFVNGKQAYEPYETVPTFESFDEVTVPEGNYFVMGDNRPNSLDSRSESVGFIPKKFIIGKTVDFK